MPDDIMKIILSNCQGYDSNDFIFGKTIALRKTNIRRQLINHAKAAGLDSIPLHSFRHSHAIHLIGSGVLIKIVLERLEHESALTTLNIYTHDVKGDEDTVLNYLNI
ncbi:MAG: tyrosine-type recombinase/integrase [Anaeroplasma bactoclasticum]|nr:tyrosine-type recombinase/integrase [Anaeroplasma bactoclasticum]MCM1557567.1 tyrosine-type recombinase/integrase [Anaeroplasma bactoclasticum]